MKGEEAISSPVDLGAEEQTVGKVAFWRWELTSWHKCMGYKTKTEQRWCFISLKLHEYMLFLSRSCDILNHFCWNVVRVSALVTACLCVYGFLNHSIIAKNWTKDLTTYHFFLSHYKHPCLSAHGAAMGGWAQVIYESSCLAMGLLPFSSTVAQARRSQGSPGIVRMRGLPDLHQIVTQVSN